MKKMTIVMMVMVLMAAGNVAADMVDVGMGQMERSEFESLKAMVQGQPVGGVPAIATSRVRSEQYGLIEMAPAAFEALRNKVAGIENVQAPYPTARAAIQMVDIGTGEMPADEFAALKRMVKDSGQIVFDGLAALHP